MDRQERSKNNRNAEDELSYVSLYLCAFLFLVYGLQTFFSLELAYRPGVEYYRFFTSFLAHSSLEHLLNNLFFIGLFGTIYEMHTDSETVLFTFVVSAVLANFTAFVFYPETFILGASAGAMGILAALAVYRPNQIGVGLGVPMPMWAVLVGYIFIDFVGLAGTNTTANEAHLAGLLVGGLMGHRLRSNKDRSKSSNRSKSKLSKENNGSQQNEDLDIDNWETKIREWEEKWMK